MTPTRALLSDGRWHFQHGPIDLIIAADGEAGARAKHAARCVAGAHQAAWQRFATVLGELVDELPQLRRPVVGPCDLRGDVARRMWRACEPHRACFVTPMAAVAGAVADTIVDCYRRDGIARAAVNNGGDIALHLAAGRSTRIGLVADLARFDGPAGDGSIAIDTRFEIHDAMAVRGIATSGWRGRSFSLGIADSVTVLARTAADADAAATMIANAVDVDDPRIVRRPASSLADDSDLGDRLVTVDVPPLPSERVDRALAAGLRHADGLRRRGLVTACLLVCQGRVVRTGDLTMMQPLKQPLEQPLCRPPARSPARPAAGLDARGAPIAHHLREAA